MTLWIDRVPKVWEVVSIPTNQPWNLQIIIYLFALLVSWNPRTGYSPLLDPRRSRPIVKQKTAMREVCSL